MTGEQHVLIENGGDPTYLPTGHIAYARAGTLLSVAFDVQQQTIAEGALPVVEGISQRSPANMAQLAHADDGMLVYMTGEDQVAERALVWVDREGREEMAAAELRAYNSLRLSPDGQRVAVEVLDDGNYDIWIYDLARAIWTRFTSGSEWDRWPLWTPDGERIVFTSSRDGDVNNLYWKAADGTGQAEHLTTGGSAGGATSFTPDGGTLVINWINATAAIDLDIGVLDMNSDRQATMLLQTGLLEGQGTISPDGRWLAYITNPSGQDQVYVRPFPNVDDGRWPISPGVGVSPQWGPDSRELFYQTQAVPGGPVALMVAENDTDPTFSPGVPIRLFEGPYRFGAQIAFHSFDISSDGRRFLMIREGTGETPDRSEIVVVQNWFEELTRLVPTP